jgi:hypothetical protein
MNRYVRIVKKDSKTLKVLEKTPEVLYTTADEEHMSFDSYPKEMLINGILYSWEIREE